MSTTDKEILLDLPPEAELQHPVAPWRDGSYQHFNGNQYADLTEEPIVVTKLRAAFPEEILKFSGYRGDATVILRSGKIVEVMQFLRDDAEIRMELLRDLFGIDNLRTADRQEELKVCGIADGRFEVIYLLYSLRFRQDLRIRVPLPEQNPALPTISNLFLCANWHEREVWDMYGIQFVGHPNLKRILNHEAFEGHPLRKDYPVNRRHNFTKPVEM